ncbi:(deoxy)nucleoside triphosphate pyrophosphohydrolase [Actinomycetota bacterium]
MSTTAPYGSQSSVSVDVVGAALVDSLDRPRRVLAARRTEPSALAGGWELPGGKVDPGESEQQALHRELVEELGVRVRLGERLPGPLPDGRWPLGTGHAMAVWLAEVTDGAPEPLEDHDLISWLSSETLYAVEWLPADLPIARALEPLLGGR